MRPDADQIQLDALRALTAEERLSVAEALRAFAWELKASMITTRHPELSAREVLERVRKAFGRDVA